MCEIKAITTFHLTEDAISLDKTFRSANVSARTHFPVWCPASNRGAIMATRCIYKMSVCMHMSMSKIMCVWVSIFIRGVEENPITTVSVEIKETDLWWLSSRSRGFCVWVWVCVFARLLRGSWQWSRGRKKAERSNKWKWDAGMSQLKINIASDPVWFIPCYTLPFFFFGGLVHQVRCKLLFWRVRKNTRNRLEVLTFIFWLNIKLERKHNKLKTRQASTSGGVNLHSFVIFVNFL